jgi:ABC-type oligopeptide transport system substrate-binding subunit
MSARVTRFALPVLLAGTVTLTGCGAGKSSSSSGARLTTPVRVQITQPTPNQVVVGDKTTLVVNLIGGMVVQRTTGPLSPTEGHIHVSLDGKLVSMAYQTTQELTGLTPGSHTATAEFVAVDHQPFKNRPTAAVIFQSQAP